MKILAGLGNPGSRYAQTRHNLGFMVLDRLAEVHSSEFRKDRFEAQVARARIGGAEVLLVKPQTYMNLSGEAVAPIARWHGIEPADVLAVCDDVSLEEGRMRFRRSGGDGGHKGLASLAKCFGSDAFPRMRIGVGQPPGISSEDWVLRRLTPDEVGRFAVLAASASEAAADWVGIGTEACMNRYNAPGRQDPGPELSEEGR